MLQTASYSAPARRTSRHTSYRDFSREGALLLEPTSFLPLCQPFITISDILFPACPWKTHESLVSSLPPLSMADCRSIQKYRRWRKIKYSWSSCGSSLIGKGVKCMCLFKRWCDFFSPWKYVLKESKHNLISAALFLPALTLRESLELPHCTPWGPAQSCQWHLLLLRHPILSGPCAWTVPFWIIAYFEKNDPGSYHAMTQPVTGREMSGQPWPGAQLGLLAVGNDYRGLASTTCLRKSGVLPSEIPVLVPTSLTMDKAPGSQSPGPCDLG